MKSLEEQPIPEASERRISWEDAARAFRIGA
jgi:hypothetical protein